MTSPPRHDHDHDDPFDRGLAFDLGTMMERRRALRLLGLAGAAGLATLAGCGDDDDTSSASSSGTSGTTGAAETSGTTGTTASAATAGTTATTTGATGATTCTEIPEETAGPYPGDGSNGPDVLSEDGVVRSDIRSSFGSSTTTAEGIPLTMTLTVTDVAAGCAPLAGAAVYAWHCDREGRYSMYSEGVEGENYLRGLQEAGSDGSVTFQSIFPACYSGRWPHVHFEVYASADDATGGGEPIATSQLALPEDVCTTVYATTGYEDSVTNLGQVSLSSDNVFGDGADSQVPVVSGDTTAGYTATLTVGV